MNWNRNVATLAVALAVSPSLAWAQTIDAGLPLPTNRQTTPAPAARTTTPAAPTAAQRRVDLRGSWTGERSAQGSDGAPGSFAFTRTARGASVDSYSIRIVANAQDDSVAASSVRATFDGTNLTITWAPTAGVIGNLHQLGATHVAATTRTLVYAHSADDEFDRLRKVSGSELPNGVDAPSELRRLKPPQVVFPAEWEQSEEILWGYHDEFSVSLIYQAALRGCSANGEPVKHRFFVATEQDERQLRYELGSAVGSAVMGRLVLFRRFAFQTVWMRDYGPWTVRKLRDGQRAVGDMAYFSGRDDDNRVPVDYANLRGWERLDLSSLHIEGGNIMSDGHGRVFLTSRTLEGHKADANDSQEDVEENLRRVGAQEVLFFERMPEPEGTGHIDMFAKLMDQRTVLVGRHEDPTYAPVLDRNAARFAALGYRVERVDFARPSHVTNVDADGLPLMTYTNSLFVGRTVLVTSYRDRERDAAALAVYRRLGWKPVPIDVRSIIAANGAIHCITMQVPAR